MNSNESLKKIIGLINTGKKYPALSLVNNNPKIAALISKLVKPRDIGGFDLRKNKDYQDMNRSQMQSISDSIKTRVKDNENLTSLFPDIELAIQILISSILSPKDMVKNELIYRCKESFLSSELILKLNKSAQATIENHYNVQNDLQTILRDTLFITGSYIKVIIPESSVDEIINDNTHVSTEAISELFITNAKNEQVTVNMGILGNSGKYVEKTALERFNTDSNKPIYSSNINLSNSNINLHLEVSDNFNLLKLPKVIEANNRMAMKSIIRNKKRSISTETNLSQTELSSLLYKNGSSSSKTFIAISSSNNAKRKSIGRPLVMKVPSEAVLPVYMPGDETKHVGYFILIDNDGNPVTMNSNQNYVDGLSGLTSGNSTNSSLSSLLIDKAKKNLVTSDRNEPSIDQITKIYGNIIETDLIDRLRNGLYSKELSIANNEEIYKIMLARSLANKFTRLIYIPSELTTYFAFKYYSNGVGKSYLDDLKILTSLRAILLFSKVMAITKSAINLTHVNIALDPNDPDPQRTVEIASHEIIKMRQQYFPLGINSPTDLVDWIQRAGFEFSFEGHPGLPQTKFDFETKNIQHTQPDSELDEMLRKQTYMALGLSPEVVDNGFNSEFATTVVSNNLLLSKRVIQLQNIFTVQLTDLCKKLLLNDNIARNELLDILKENKALVEKNLSDDETEDYNLDHNKFFNDVLDRYIDTIEIDLPKPDEVSIDAQTTAFDSYIEAVDKSLDYWISTEIITSDISGEISGNIDSIKAIVKSYFIRKWMSENNYMSELSDIVTTNEDGGPTMNINDINKSHIEGVIRSSIDFINSLNPIKKASNTDLENMNVEQNDEANADSVSEMNTDITDETTDEGIIDETSDT